jgi:hypothetical protein
MRKVLIGSVVGVAAVAATAFLLWPHAPQAQINADGCTCSRATQLGAGREALAIYHCVCPGTQCVITATQAGTGVPPQVEQTCK